MNINVETIDKNFDFSEILDKFKSKESLYSGSIVIHSGKVKYPGKKLVNLTHVLLEKKTNMIKEELYKIGMQAAQKFYVLQIYINHRLGKALPGDDILLVIVSAPDRNNAFCAAQWIVDEIKKETIVSLVEMGKDE